MQTKIQVNSINLFLLLFFLFSLMFKNRPKCSRFSFIEFINRTQRVVQVQREIYTKEKLKESLCTHTENFECEIKWKRRERNENTRNKITTNCFRSLSL